MNGLEQAIITPFWKTDKGVVVIFEVKNGDKSIRISDDKMVLIKSGAMRIDWGTVTHKPSLFVTAQPNPKWDSNWGDKEQHTDKNGTHFRYTPETMNKAMAHKKIVDDTFNQLIENYDETIS